MFKKKDKKKDYEIIVEGKLSDYPHLMKIKPKQGYIFNSNYYKCDNDYFSILSFFHVDGSIDDFNTFWGIDLIPTGLDEDISVTNIESVERMSDSWVLEHQSQAENVAQMNTTEQNNPGSSKTNRLKANKREEDLEQIAFEIQSGAVYLACSFRIKIKAPTLEKLDNAIKIIERHYIDSFTTLYATSYDGEQRRELTSILSPISVKKGKPFYFTSTEYAGAYSLVTRGIEDDNGEYIGTMFGDVNTAAILFDIDRYKRSVIVCNEQIDLTYGRNYAADLWGSKISQSCLINNHKVAHIILDGCNLFDIGPEFPNITRKVDLNKGDVNMFEMFGDFKDELSLFSMQMEKIALMTEQLYPPTDYDRSIIRGYVKEIATKFYIDQGMWYENAKENRDRLRVVGIPHKDVPKLELFSTYLQTSHKASLMSGVHDEEEIHALKILNQTYKSMLDNNGDLFNTITTKEIDDCIKARRVIYDFSQLLVRGKGIMMAQLINIISFVTGNLGLGDTLIIHGAELIDDTVKEYMTALFEQMFNKGGRVVFLYNDNEKMLDDVGFSHVDKADYTIMGYMTDNCVARYQDVLGQTIPSNLVNLITTKNDSMTFLHRDYNNVVFRRDLILKPKVGRK